MRNPAPAMAIRHVISSRNDTGFKAESETVDLLIVRPAPKNKPANSFLLSNTLVKMSSAESETENDSIILYVCNIIAYNVEYVLRYAEQTIQFNLRTQKPPPDNTSFEATVHICALLFR